MSILSKLQQDAVGDLALLEEPETILFTQIEAQQLVITGRCEGGGAFSPLLSFDDADGTAPLEMVGLDPGKPLLK